MNKSTSNIMTRPDHAEINYNLLVPIPLKSNFTALEKDVLRPIAEVLAMLDGNAFFTAWHGDKLHYEQYLPEAWALFEQNGGFDGWAGEASFVKNLGIQTPAVREAYEHYLTLRDLAKENKE